MTTWLVTGAGGTLGRDVLAELAADPDAEVTGRTRGGLDITDPQAVRATVAGHSVVVNCAAWTDVDGAEGEKEAATAVNGTGVRHLARACAETGAVLLHVSTHYVFPGDAGHPYAEDAPTGPLNAYGRGELLGERAVAELLPRSGCTVHTAWLYGTHGRNFVATMLDLARRRETLDVVADQHGQPTWSRALARQLAALGRAALAGQAPAGVYHGTAAGRTTWYGLAREAYRLSGLDPERIRPVGSEAFPGPRSPAGVRGAGTRRLAAHRRPVPGGLAGPACGGPGDCPFRGTCRSRPYPGPRFRVRAGARRAPHTSSGPPQRVAPSVMAMRFATT